MKSAVRRSGLVFSVITLLLSVLFNILTASSVFAAPVEKSLEYKKVAEITKDCPVVQGSTSDGTYVYVACNYDENSKTKLVKLRLDGTEIMRKDMRGQLGHANDMAYNSKRKLLIVTLWDFSKDNGKLALLSPDDFSIVDYVQADSGSWSNLCYSAAKGQYVSNGVAFDENFKKVKTLFKSSVMDKYAKGGTNQGMACDESYIYTMRGGLGGGVTSYTGKFKIFVFNWSGDLLEIYDMWINKWAENESMFVANGKLYLAVNAGKSGGSSFNEQFGTIEGALTGRGETGAGSTHPLTIGSYNLHGTLIDGESGCKAKTRFETAAKNIMSMGMDIVGMQEYSDYDDSKSPDCNGEQVKLLDILNNASGGNWKATKLPDEADGGGYQESQASILYNSAVTSLVSDDVKNVDGGSIKDDAWKNVSNCNGGSPIHHIAGFSDASGNTFYVANGHWCTQNGDQRKKDTEAIVKIMSDYSGAKFIIGDTNSEVGEEVEKVMATVSYGDAHTTAATKNAAEYGTMAGNGKGKNIIDRIYYEQATVSSPSTYTTLNCKKATTCGSDHRPISAVFPSIMVGAGDQDCSGNQKEVFDLGIPYFNVNTCVCSAATSGDSRLSGDTLAEQAFTFFVSTAIESNGSKPLNAAQAAGIVGNLMIETGGGTYDLDPEAVNGIGASGIVQWLGGRKTALESFAAKKEAQRKRENKSGEAITWKDFRTQLQFVVDELETGYRKAVMEGKNSSSKTIDKGLKNITDISEQGAKDAADIVARYYEIPSISDAYPNRQTAAVKAFNDFKDNAPGTISSVNASGDCGGSDDSVGSGDVQALLDKAKEYAWVKGKDSEAGGSKQKSAYKNAVATAKKNGWHIGGNSGNDCAGFINILMRTSGYETNWPNQGTSGLANKLRSLKGWTEVKDAKQTGSFSTNKLKPGDVLVTPSKGHVLVYIGKVDWTSYQFVEAAYGSNRAPYTMGTPPSFWSGGYVVFRKDS